MDRSCWRVFVSVLKEVENVSDAVAVVDVVDVRARGAEGE